ncbi:MAG: thiolase family protein [FCB group bacterium]|nr:thiolase family protein [FCB group bacterium]
MTAALDYHPHLFRGYEFPWNDMGLTAEKLSAEFNITRREQDAYTLQSNQRYFRARETGFFNREIVPVTLPNGTRVIEDQEPRLSSPETLGQLRPVFKKEGTVTAANSSGVSDGCSLALVAGAKETEELGREPLAEIKATVTIGLDPTRMGLGPVPAIRKLLRRTNLTMDDIDLFEINEAFAVQVLACQKELKLDSDRLNTHGGAVALGHPLGMSGLRLAVTLAHSLAERNLTRGIAALCVGHGQGVAMLLERSS